MAELMMVRHTLQIRRTLSLVRRTRPHVKWQTPATVMPQMPQGKCIQMFYKMMWGGDERREQNVGPYSRSGGWSSAN